MNNASDFVIENGVLTKYTGPGGDVVIPDGVTKIGNYAFFRGSSPTSIVIPDSVTSIGFSAFLNCSKLTNVVIPDSMIIIENNAFERCSSLTNVAIPDSVTSVGNSAFRGCGKIKFTVSKKAANRPMNFKIENGILKKYTGPGGDVVIPAGVTGIGEWAFNEKSSLVSVEIPNCVTTIGEDAFVHCINLTCVTIPAGVTNIEKGTFYGCHSLTSVIIPEGVTSIGTQAFSDCQSLARMTIPKSVTSVGDEAFSGCTSLQTLEIQGEKCTLGKEPFGRELPKGLRKHVDALYPHLTDGSLKQYILEKKTWKTLTPELRAEIFLARQSKALTPGYRACITEDQLPSLSEAILACLSEAKPSTKDCAAAATYMTLFKEKLNAETLQAMYARLQPLKTAAKALKTIEDDLTLKEKLGQQLTVDSALPPLEKLIAEKQSQKDLEAKLKNCYSLTFKELPTVQSSSGADAEPFVLAWLLTAHEALDGIEWGQPEVYAAYEKPGLNPEAKEVVALLEPKSLQAAITVLADTHLVAYQSTRKKFLTYPICRYADEATMAELTKRAPSWRTSVSGNDAPPLWQLRDAVKYSDTRAAMLFAERYHELDRYAKLRGVTEDELRDQYLSDVGLDEQGGKAYDLGNQTVTARLQKDLSFLFELPDGKTAKSLPKKGADEEKYNAAKADFDEMRKAVKKILKSRGTVLFEDFLSGRKRGSGEWRSAYISNPVLRMAASLIVWSQGKKTFTLADGGAIDSAEQPYTITQQPIRVAHPMEMKSEDVKAWQKYFSARGLKQPFAQVWEPVIDPAAMKKDRYEGSVQPVYRFAGKDKHGIHSGNLHAFSEDLGFTLDDCELEHTASAWRVDFDANDITYTLGKFSFPQYTRKVNHIVSLLDSWTVEDRLKKDDVSVMDLMDSFTLAQITEFIAAAQEAKALNVLALLLEYKNTHFADFDPMDEFTLEW